MSIPDLVATRPRRAGPRVAIIHKMSDKTLTPDTIPLEQLLAELTDARLEKREDDIARLQAAVEKRQATGETVPKSDSGDTPPDVVKKAF